MSMYEYSVYTEDGTIYRGVVCGEDYSEAMSELTEFYYEYHITKITLEDMETTVITFSAMDKLLKK